MKIIMYVSGSKYGVQLIGIECKIRIDLIVFLKKN